MRLRGLYGESLGGFPCIRGYASLGDLAKISQADKTFQRELIDKHQKEIHRFLQKSEYLFFPEVVLSYELKYDYNKSGAISGLIPIQLIKDKQKFTSNIDGISFSSNKGDYQMVKIDIPDNLITGATKPFFRIDGNHRLSAAPLSTDFEKYNTPFCIILFTEETSVEVSKRVIFHNINSKSVVLTPEENLRVIIDKPELFSDELLKTDESFGWDYYYARQLRDFINKDILPNIYGCFTNHNSDQDVAIRATLTELCRFLMERKLIGKQEQYIMWLKSSLKNVNNAFAGNRLKTESSRGFMIACIAQLLISKKQKMGKLSSFIDWALESNIHKIKELKPPSLIDIYQSFREVKNKTIFISMPFEKRANERHYKIIKEVTEEINREYNQFIKIKPIRIDQLDEGYSYQITEKILEMIETSGLLIADLTGGNKNVYHELGFLMGLDKATKIGYKNFILLIKMEDGKDIEKEIGFNIKHIQQLRFEELYDLKTELKKKLITYYKF